MTIRADELWPPLLNEYMAHNGSTAQAIHGIAIEQAIRHLCGFGYQHAGCSCFDSTNGSRTIATTLTQELRVCLLPYARDLDVWLLIDGALDAACSISVAMGAATTLNYTWIGTGAATPDAVAGWQKFAMRGVETGVATSDGNMPVVITNTCLVSVELFGAVVRQVFNPYLG